MPREAREALGVGAGDELVVNVEKGKVMITANGKHGREKPPQESSWAQAGWHRHTLGTCRIALQYRIQVQESIKTIKFFS